MYIYRERDIQQHELDAAVRPGEKPGPSYYYYYYYYYYDY